MYTYIKAREVADDGTKPLADRLLRKLDLPHVERPDAANLVARVDHRRRFALGDGGQGRGGWRHT